MKQTVKIIMSVFFILTLSLSAVACRSGQGNEFQSNSNDTNSAQEIEDPYVGVYYGRSDETHYGNNGEHVQREKTFYVYKHLNFYYATTAVSTIQETGEEEYFKKIYVEGNRDIDRSFCSGNVSEYTDICHLNDVQNTSAAYKITFGDNGTVEIKWNSTSVYGDDEPQPYEEGVFTGSKK